MAAKLHRDRKGYYRALGISHDASQSEITLAYKLLKQTDPQDLFCSKGEIMRAYEILKNPVTRNEYDLSEVSGRRSTLGFHLGRGRLGSPRLLAACVVLLLGILVFVWLPLYGSRFRTFSPGDRLVDLKGAPFGVVVQMNEEHAFSPDISAPGYLIELTGDQQLRWFPATDIQATCRRAD